MLAAADIPFGPGVEHCCLVRFVLDRRVHVGPHHRYRCSGDGHRRRSDPAREWAAIPPGDTWRGDGTYNGQAEDTEPSG